MAEEVSAEGMVAGVGSGRKKKMICRGKRKEETMVILGVGGGQPVVALMTCGGFSGRQAGGDFGWWLE